MKINSKHLTLAMNQLRAELFGQYSSEHIDMDIEMSKEDPGSGSMVDCLTLTASTSVNGKDTQVVVEVFNALDKQEPAVTKVETFRIKV